MQLNRKVLFVLSLFTLVGFSLLGIATILFFQERNLSEAFAGMVWYWQAAYGLGYGTGVALIAISLVKTTYLQPITDFFRDIFSQSELKFSDVVFASISAGIGEELLFRGGIQPFLGIWITAILFILIHGYLDPRNNRLFLYGFLMVFMSAGLGYLCEYVGLLSAMIAHAVFDVFMFAQLLYGNNTDSSNC